MVYNSPIARPTESVFFFHLLSFSFALDFVFLFRKFTSKHFRVVLQSGASAMVTMTPLQLRLIIAGTLVSVCFLFWASTVQNIIEPAQVRKLAGSLLQSSASKSPKENPDGLAYMTFLTGTMANISDPDPDHDRYYVATRVLGYQLLHQPETRSNQNIPFVVLVTDDITEEKRERLTKDGATVIPVDYLRGQDWIVGEMPQWRDVMTKLRAWQLKQYSRVAFLDGDMILNRCMDGLFDDPATQRRDSIATGEYSSEIDSPIPSSYLLASIPETNPFHAYPPTAENGDFKDPDYFNAGFFVFSPSDDVFDYYTSLMEREGSFDPQYPEQNLMNHAHRKEGMMPWQHMNSTWNIRFPSIDDKNGGVASMHDKWWSAHMDKRLQPYYTATRWKMEGFYQAKDQGF